MGIVKKIEGISSYFHRNFFLPRFYSHKYREILSRNRELKNKYAGKRCFIIAGGPSVAKLDFSLFKNEYVIVMNEFDKNPNFRELTPELYVISDSIYYDESKTDYWPERFRIKDRSIGPKTTVLVNLGGKDFVEKNNLFKGRKVYYLGTQGIFTDNFSFNIDLDKYVPSPKNSVLLCLMAAVYSGFSTIYLLGCEHSFLTLRAGPNRTLVDKHSYEDELTKIDPNDRDAVKKYIDPRDLLSSYEKCIANVLQLFRNYRLFYKLALKKYPKLEIYNATPDSYLDVFPAVNFEDIKF